MPRPKPIYLKQKVPLYFDENFPVEIIDQLRRNRSFTKAFRVHSAADFGNNKKSDGFHFEFCRYKRFVLVTLDKGFMDDRKFPIDGMNGLICVIAGRNNHDHILSHLLRITRFIAVVPFPRTFVGDSKFQVSNTGCVMRARDSVTREIKTVAIKPGDSVEKIANVFSYFGSQS
jgi:hypothetical protein